LMKKLFHLLIGGFGLATIQSASATGGVDAPPPPSARPEIKFAAPKETKLPNGLRVIVAERPDLPLLAAQILVRNGAEADPEGLAGAASMTGALLTKGTETMPAPEIASVIESLGGSIDSGAGWDASAASVAVMSDKAKPALKILADVVLHPAFKQEEIDRLKSQRLDNLRVALQQPGSLARFVTDRVVFGARDYGHAVIGTLESLQTIARDQIAKFYKSHYAPQNAAFILAGNVTLEQGRDFAEEFFGAWKNEGLQPNETQRFAVTDWKPQSVVIDMPEAGQAAVTVAKPAIKRNSPEYYPALVANAALGNGFVSRLNREIRIKRGLSYGAGSSIDARRQPGPFNASAQTKNQSAAEVATLIESELKRVATDPVQGEELRSRQAVLTGRYARSLETNQGFVSQISNLAAYDLPLDTLDKFIPSIDAVTTEEVTAFAKKYFTTPASLVIVGKAADFLEALRKNFPDARVIEQKDLDLNRADLVKAK
jgi:zinc protease